MKHKKVVVGLSALILIILFLTSVFAITASIGNARMILRVNVGDTIEKSILVKNTNNETVKIDSFPSGDLAKDVIIKNSNFTLNAGEERDINFKIKINKANTTETKINIKFTPVNGTGGGVGLSSTIIIIAGGDENIDDSENDSLMKDALGNFIKSKIGIALIITAIIFLIFIFLFIFYLKKGSKKEIKNEEVKLNKPKKS